MSTTVSFVDWQPSESMRSNDIAVAARNTAGASDPFYTRKIANLVAAGVGHAALGEDALRSYDGAAPLAVGWFDGEDLHCTLCLVTPSTRTAHTNTGIPTEDKGGHCDDFL